MEIKVWTYSEGDEFPNRRSSFFRRHWEAFLIAFVAIILAAAAWSSIAARSASQPSFTPDSPYVYDGADVLDYSVADTLTQLTQRIGAGDSKKDNGVLYTFVKSTHQDRLEVGYGLEDRLTD